jgi:hypothetical protein
MQVMQLAEQLDGLRAGPVVERQGDETMAASAIEAGDATVPHDDEGTLLVAKVACQ